MSNKKKLYLITIIIVVALAITILVAFLLQKKSDKGTDEEHQQDIVSTNSDALEETVFDALGDSEYYPVIPKEISNGSVDLVIPKGGVQRWSVVSTENVIAASETNEDDLVVKVRMAEYFDATETDADYSTASVTIDNPVLGLKYDISLKLDFDQVKYVSGSFETVEKSIDHLADDDTIDIVKKTKLPKESNITSISKDYVSDGKTENELEVNIVTFVYNQAEYCVRMTDKYDLNTMVRALEDSVGTGTDVDYVKKDIKLSDKSVKKYMLDEKSIYFWADDGLVYLYIYEAADDKGDSIVEAIISGNKIKE